MVRFLPGHLSWHYKGLASSFWRKLFVGSEEFLLPGDLMHIVCRKYYIMEWVKDAISQGYSQVVILGAGLDHLGAYAASSGIPVFEIDTPAMVRQKQFFLNKHGYTSPYHHCCALDVRGKQLQDILNEQEDFRADQKTLFVAEGFFDYLTLETTRSVLSQLAVLAPDHRLITTLFSLEELNFFHRLSFTSGVAMVGEAIRLPLNYEGMLNELQSLGYYLQKEIDHRKMEAELVQPAGLGLPVLKGFYILELSSAP